MEVAVFCDGMCGSEGNRRVFRLFDDQTAEYERSNAPNPWQAAKSVLERRVIALSPDEVAQFLNHAKSAEFLNAAAYYEKKLSFVDAVYVKTIVYRFDTQEKRLMIANYSVKVDYPEPVKRIVDVALELSSR